MSIDIRPGDIFIYRKPTHGQSPSLLINIVESTQQAIDGCIHAATVRTTTPILTSVNVDASGIDPHHDIENKDDVDICIRRLKDYTITPPTLDNAIELWWSRCPKNPQGKSSYDFIGVGVATFWKAIYFLSGNKLWRRRITRDDGHFFCSESVVAILQQATCGAFKLLDPMNGMPISEEVATPGDLKRSKQFITISDFDEVRS
jgi:hypothetical protein